MSTANTVQHDYAYAKPSGVRTSGGQQSLTLSTSGGVTEKYGEAAGLHPYFFQGSLLEPVISARCLSTLAKIVAARYTMTPQEWLAMKDPVVTSGGGYLRFEGFSGCAGVYGRLDLTPRAYDGVVVDCGTTNVDFNPPMRQALARVRPKEPIGLAVGEEEVALLKGDDHVVEQKVKLPTRWIRGFTEVQAYLSRMEPRFELPRVAAIRFLRSLPRQVPGSAAVYVTSAAKGLRITSTRSKEGVHIRGIERLKLLDDLVPHVQALRIYAEPEGETSTWELDFGGQAFFLTLSPENHRGFSGEGQVLSDLATGLRPDVLDQTHASLNWQAAMNPGHLAGEWGFAEDEVRAALGALGSRGLVGYDLRQATYFHRVLPFDLSTVDRMHPRLLAAQKLVAEQKVTLFTGLDDSYVLAEVPGTDVTHRVQELAEGFRCTCQWFTKYQGRRGPCKHILATQITAQRRTDG